jgi:excisionase family DNA binding protein
MNKRAVFTVPEAGELLGLGRSAAYEAVRRGDIPSIKLGRRRVVPKPAMFQLLGLSEPESDALRNVVLAPLDVNKQRAG